MKTLIAAWFVAMSFLFSGVAVAATPMEQPPAVSQEIQGQDSRETKIEAEPCQVAWGRCPACCTNNCSDCSACKPKALETQT